MGGYGGIMKVKDFLFVLLDTDLEFWVFGHESGILWNGDIFDMQSAPDIIMQRNIKYMRIEDNEITIHLEEIK